MDRRVSQLRCERPWSSQTVSMESPAIAFSSIRQFRFCLYPTRFGFRRISSGARKWLETGCFFILPISNNSGGEDTFPILTMLISVQIPFTSPYICLNIRLPFCLSSYPAVCPSFYPSVFLSVFFFIAKAPVRGGKVVKRCGWEAGWQNRWLDRNIAGVEKNMQTDRPTQLLMDRKYRIDGKVLIHFLSISVIPSIANKRFRWIRTEYLK